MVLPPTVTRVTDMMFVTWNSLSKIAKDIDWTSFLHFLELGNKGNSMVLIKILLLALCMTSNSSQEKNALGYVPLYTSLGDNSCHGLSPYIPMLMTSAEFHRSSNSGHEFPK